MRDLLSLALVLPLALASAPAVSQAPAADSDRAVLGGGDELRVYVPGVALEGGDTRIVGV
jgi:protein involved in polysaccharide export with SLBB domain